MYGRNTSASDLARSFATPNLSSHCDDIDGEGVGPPMGTFVHRPVRQVCVCNLPVECARRASAVARPTWCLRAEVADARSASFMAAAMSLTVIVHQRPRLMRSTLARSRA